MIIFNPFWAWVGLAGLGSLIWCWIGTILGPARTVIHHMKTVKANNLLEQQKQRAAVTINPDFSQT